MKRIKLHLYNLKRSLFNRSETFALEGGIFFGPGKDPKGTFYNPKLGIYWYQPDSVITMDEPAGESGLIRNWLSKLGGLRKSA